MRLLDTIAIALTTGKPGEVFAAAFDKREKMQLILAKNGPPTPDDIAAATELMELIGSPAISNAMDLFPFLIRRCGLNLNKRIRNFHTSIREVQNDFTLALEEYDPAADITAEFPGVIAGHLLEDYGDAVPPFTTLLGRFVERITDLTAEGLDTRDVSASTGKYAATYFFAGALGHSRFLNILVRDRDYLNRKRKGRAEKLKQRLDNICQYVTGISDLIRKAKRLFPIPYRWVKDTGECVFALCDTPYETISRALDYPSSSSEIANELHKDFPAILRNWERQQTMHTYIHAELRIILHLGLLSAIEPLIHPIGVSKRSCFCCTLWIESHNRIFGTEWLTSAAHGKPHVNWALPGAACSYAIQADGEESN